MEIILAIVWYLALLMPGNSYTQENVYDIAYNNFEAVEYVAENNFDDAIIFYNSNNPEDNNVFLPGCWDKEPIDHTDKSLWDPFAKDIRKKKDSTENANNGAGNN